MDIDIIEVKKYFDENHLPVQFKCKEIININIEMKGFLFWKRYILACLYIDGVIHKPRTLRTTFKSKDKAITAFGHISG